MTERNGQSLPKDWLWVRLHDISVIIAGQSPPGETYRKVPEGMPFFQGKADFGSKHPVPRVWCIAPLKIAMPGDILISVRAPVGPTNVADVECCIGRGLAAIRCQHGTDKEFVLLALRFFEGHLASLGSGSTFGAISRNQLEDLMLPLPPLPEQRRLARLLQERIADAERARAAAEEQAEAAGRLKAALFRKLLSRASAAAWPRVRLQAILDETRNGLYKPDEFYGEGTRILKMFNIGRFDGAWMLDRVDRIRLTPQEEATYRLNVGDILLNRVNSRELVGKCAMIGESLAGAVFESKNIRVRVDRAKANPAYVAAFLNCPDVRHQVGSRLKQIVGQATVNRDDLDALEVVLPPLKDQTHMAEQLMEQQGVIDSLEAAIFEQGETVKRLPAALLAEAFAGGL